MSNRYFTSFSQNNGIDTNAGQESFVSEEAVFILIPGFAVCVYINTYIYISNTESIIQKMKYTDFERVYD